MKLTASKSLKKEEKEQLLKDVEAEKPIIQAGQAIEDNPPLVKLAAEFKAKRKEANELKDKLERLEAENKKLSGAALTKGQETKATYEAQMVELVKELDSITNSAKFHDDYHITNTDGTPVRMATKGAVVPLPSTHPTAPVNFITGPSAADPNTLSVSGKHTMVKYAGPTTTRTELAAKHGFSVSSSGGFVRSTVLSDFKVDVAKLLANIDKSAVREMVVKQVSTQDVWDVVSAFLTVAESLDLIGICTAAMLVGQTERNELHAKLGSINVLKNKAGKLQRGLVFLAGHIGAAAASSDPVFKGAVGMIPNPLLREPVKPFVARARGTGQTPKEYEEAKASQKEGYDRYKAVHDDTMAKYAPRFDTLEKELMAQIKSAVLSWTIGTQ